MRFNYYFDQIRAAAHSSEGQQWPQVESFQCRASNRKCLHNNRNRPTQGSTAKRLGRDALGLDLSESLPSIGNYSQIHSLHGITKMNCFVATGQVDMIGRVSLLTAQRLASN